MKQNILFMSAVAAVAMFASCSNDSLVSDTAPASDPQIKFNTSMKNITRAVTTNENFTSFKVSAFEDGSTRAYFSDEEVTKSGSTWSSSNNLYWPKSGKKLNFFAYSPTLLTPTTTSTEITITGFNLSTSLADQTDILVAYEQQQYNASSSDNKVSLNFKHALSNIVINARNETAGGYVVKVKGVRVGKVKPSGDFSFDGTNYTWSNYEGAPDNYEIGGKDDDSYTEVTVVTGNSNSSNLMNHEELLIIPQSSTTTPIWNPTVTNDQGARISICCQISNGSTRIFPAADLTGVNYGWISVPLPENYNWEANKKYIYTVRFFPDGTGNTGNVDPEDPDLPDVPSDPIPDVKIEFTAVMETWQNGNGTGETIPSETD